MPSESCAQGSPFQFSSLLSLPPQWHLLNKVPYNLSVYLSVSLENEFFEGRGCVSFVYFSAYLSSCLAHSGCFLNTGWMTKWTLALDLDGWMMSALVWLSHSFRGQSCLEEVWIYAKMRWGVLSEFVSCNTLFHLFNNSIADRFSLQIYWQILLRLHLCWNYGFSLVNPHHSRENKSWFDSGFFYGINSFT